MSIMPPSGVPADSKAGHADKVSNEYEVMQHGYSMLEVGGSNKTAPRVRSDRVKNGIISEQGCTNYGFRRHLDGRRSSTLLLPQDTPTSYC